VVVLDVLLLALEVLVVHDDHRVDRNRNREGDRNKVRDLAPRVRGGCAERGSIVSPMSNRSSATQHSAGTHQPKKGQKRRSFGQSRSRIGLLAFRPTPGTHAVA
jgi:hypothetical protein